MLVCGLACVVCVYALHALTKCAIKINAAGGNSVIRRDKDVLVHSCVTAQSRKLKCETIHPI